MTKEMTVKTRIPYVVVSLLLFTLSAFAGDPARAAADNPGGDGTVRERAGVGDVLDRYDRTAKVAFIFDGVEFPAGTRLPEKSLTWVITREDHQKGTFHLFTSADVAQAYMKKRTPGVGSESIRDGKVEPNWPGSCYWTASYTRFEKSRGCGDTNYLAMYSPNDSYSQLDSISWNNSISCVYAACDWYWTTLYSCRNYQMTTGTNCSDPDRLYIEGGLIVSDLDVVGFNNRTSSTRFE
jgi:hypothetical protein